MQSDMIKCINCIHSIAEDGAYNELLKVYEDVYRCELNEGADYFNVFYPHTHGCSKGSTNQPNISRS